MQVDKQNMQIQLDVYILLFYASLANQKISYIFRFGTEGNFLLYVSF